MAEWYYARNGQQMGPVTLEELIRIANSGAITPSDLVWTASMSDWTPAAQLPGLFSALQVSDSLAAGASPPSLSPAPSSRSFDAAPEIPFGSDPIELNACAKCGFELTKRHFPMILLIGLVYYAIIGSASMLSSTGAAVLAPLINRAPNSEFIAGSILFSLQLIEFALGIFLGLGLTRISLNIVAGKPFSVAQLFGEGDRLLRSLGASLLFAIAMLIGLLLLVAPGIYVFLRFGLYQYAIVDRNAGILESFRYASAITTHNRGRLLLLTLLLFAANLLGLLACGIGLIFTLPLSWLAWTAAYLWMQKGRGPIEAITATPVDPVMVGQNLR